MSTFSIFLILIIIVAFLLVVVVMVQEPKGGGLASTFGGGSQQMGGVKKTTDFLDKSTWALATLLLVLILISNLAIPNANGATNESKALDGDATEQTMPIQNNNTTTNDTASDKVNPVAKDSNQ